MKFKKLTAIVASLAMVSTMFVSTVAQAAISPDVPAVSLEAGEYYTMENEGTTYYFVDIDVTYNYTGEFLEYSSSGFPVAKDNVRGISSYGFAIDIAGTDFSASAASNHKGTAGSLGAAGVDAKFNWNFSTTSEMITENTGTFGKFTIFTTNPKAGTTVSLVDSAGNAEIVIKEITNSAETGSQRFDNTTLGASSISVEIPAYEPGEEITVKSVNVKPATTTVAGEAQETFTAEVIGSDDNPYSDQNVTWSATAGTITDEGVFTAPAATDKDQTITITATSDADDSVSGTATVTVPKKEDEPQPQQPTTAITANNGIGGVYFDVAMNGNGESITDANVVVAGPTADGEGKEVTFNIINYGDVQGELSFIIGILTDIAGDYTGTSNVTTGVGAATDSATVAFPAAQ